MNVLFASNREFRIWLFTVSHSMLLLRSVRTPQFPTRIDVLFKGVSQMCLPSTLEGIDIAEVEEQSIVQPRQDPRRKYALSADASSWVIASVVAWHEDTLSDSEPSHFSVPRLVW